MEAVLRYIMVSGFPSGCYLEVYHGVKFTGEGCLEVYHGVKVY